MKRKALIMGLLLVCVLCTPVIAAAGKDPDEKKEKKQKKPRKKTEEVTQAEAAPVPADEKAAAQATAPEEVTEPKKREHTTGTLRGQVLTESGRPLPGVDVLCIDVNGQVVAMAVTNADGLYEFDGLPRGEYTISASYSGVSGPLQIPFPDGATEPPPPPGKLTVIELYRDTPGVSMIRAEWAKAPKAVSYRCELLRAGDETPILQRPDLIQNFYEFEDLQEDTAYEVRVYAKNDAGYSAAKSGSIKTVHKPPFPPTGLGVIYARNNRVELIWNAGRSGSLTAYLIQVKKGEGPYLYLGARGLTQKRDSAILIEETGRREMTYTIEGTGGEGNPILENLVPYSFRVVGVDRDKIHSKPSSPVAGIVLEDTVPPGTPRNVRYEFIGQNRLKISWESPDRDVVKYRVAYGVDRERWDSVVFTQKPTYELLFNRSQLGDKDLIVSITAIDGAGNESGYKPVERTESVAGREKRAGDIIITSENVYKDLSVALRTATAVPKKKTPPGVKGVETPQRPVAGRLLGMSELRKKGFTVQTGETARIDRDVLLPEKTIIKVEQGGTLVVENAEIGADSGFWGGIRFMAGSSGRLKNAVLKGAVTGIAVLNSDGTVQIHNVQVLECAEKGIYIKNSRVELTYISLEGNTVGLHTENSKILLGDSVVKANGKGVLADNYSTIVLNSKFEDNNEYGLRVYGGGKIEKSVFKNNLVGIVLEQGRGSVQIKGCRVELNRMDGIVSGASNADITENLVSSNGRHGIFLRDRANPNISENDIVNNRAYGVTGGGRVMRSFIAYNNGSPYYDDTAIKGKPDNVFSSSSSGLVKQIVDADYISDLKYSSVVR